MTITTEQVWLEYRSVLRAFLLSRVHNVDDAEDLLQDILIKVHRSLSSLNSQEKLKSWLFQIAQNTIMDFYRAKQRSGAIHPDDLWWEHTEADAEHELEQCVAPFINALPQKYSELLSAIELKGESQKDYATQHDISYSTLKSRVQKGRELLKNNFERCCVLSFDSRGSISKIQAKSDNCKSC